MVSCRVLLFSRLMKGSYFEGLFVMPMMLAHSASVRSFGSLPK